VRVKYREYPIQGVHNQTQNQRFNCLNAEKTKKMHRMTDKKDVHIPPHTYIHINRKIEWTKICRVNITERYKTSTERKNEGEIETVRGGYKGRRR
jgi:hypothetical protein